MKLNTPGFKGANLRRGRDARGISASDLAKKLDVTRQQVYNYEQNRQSPSPELADKICQALNMPLAFFLDNYWTNQTTLDEAITFYRSMSAATKTARTMAEEKFNWLVQLVNVLELFVEFPEVNIPVFDIPSNPLKITDAMIEEIAIEVRRYWGLSNGPISNFVWLIENHGAIVVRTALNATTLDAFSRWVDERPYIVLNSDKNCAVRSRFDVAHELGHLILHRNLPEIYLKTPEYFKLIEAQAHRFAGAIQFPQDAFAKEVVSVHLEQFRFLKLRWKLAIAMMIKRAEDLEFIGEEKGQTLWRNYARRQWRNQEPYDDQLPVEIPKLVKNAVEVILNEGVFTRQDILKEMHLYHRDVEDCAGLLENFLNPNLGEVHILRPRLRNEIKGSKEKPGDLLQFPFSENLMN